MAVGYAQGPDDLRRALKAPMTDAAYAAEWEAEAKRLRASLEAIRDLFVWPLVDGANVKRIVTDALGE